MSGTDPDRFPPFYGNEIRQKNRTGKHPIRMTQNQGIWLEGSAKTNQVFSCICAWMWPSFESQTRCHMWVEFVAGSHPCSSFPPPPIKTNISKFQFDLGSEGHRFVSLSLLSVTLVKLSWFLAHVWLIHVNWFLLCTMLFLPDIFLPQLLVTVL